MNNRGDKREAIREHGFYLSTPSGRSMRPMLRGEKDNILVEAYEGRLRPLDVALYERQDGSHVLHRIIKVRESDYLIRGDNCDYTESGITDADMIGKLTGFWRGNRFISCESKRYRLYARVWTWLYPFRFLRLRAWRKIRGLLSRSCILKAVWHKLRPKSK